MDERRIEDVLRAGPPNAPRHAQGSFVSALAARESGQKAEATFDVRLRPRSTIGLAGLAAAAAIVLAITGLLTITRPWPGATPAPTPSPTASGGASDGGRGAPVELIDRWVGPVRTIASLADPATRAYLVIQGAELRFDAGPGQSPNLFRSSVAQEGADVLVLTAGSPSLGCAPFDEGRYGWALSPGGSQLTITLLDDACAERAAALPGTWVHTACRNPNQDCLGPIEAGVYASTDFDPTGTAAVGQLGYTLPAGWANSSDHPLNFSLRPVADYLADPGFDGGDTVSGIYLWAGTLATEQPEDCSAVPAPDVAAAAAEIADHIATLEGVLVLDRRTTDFDGRTAYELDLDIAPTWTAACPWSNGDPFRSLIMFADVGVDGGVSGMALNGGHHIWFTDVAPGRVLSIWVEGERAGFDELLAAARPIVESMWLEANGAGT